MSLQSAKAMEEQQKAESLLSPRCPLLYSLSRFRKWDSVQSHCYGDASVVGVAEAAERMPFGPFSPVRPLPYTPLYSLNSLNSLPLAWDTTDIVGLPVRDRTAARDNFQC